MKVLIGTTSKGKQAEFRRMIANTKGLESWEFVFLNDINYTGDDIKEGIESLQENAIIKTKALYSYVKENNINIDYIISDDTGLFVDAFPDILGVQSRRTFEGTHDEQCEALIEEMKYTDDSCRGAHYTTYMAIANKYGNIRCVEGTVQGSIAHSVSTNEGFFWDKVFLTLDGRYFNEISTKEKDSIGHRGLAFARAIIAIKNFNYIQSF